MEALQVVLDSFIGEYLVYCGTSLVSPLYWKLKYFLSKFQQNFSSWFSPHCHQPGWLGKHLLFNSDPAIKQWKFKTSKKYSNWNLKSTFKNIFSLAVIEANISKLIFLWDWKDVTKSVVISSNKKSRPEIKKYKKPETWQISSSLSLMLSLWGMSVKTEDIYNCQSCILSWENFKNNISQKWI